MKEIKPLTSLRAFAAFLVFMFHYAWVYSPANRGVEFAGEWVPLMRVWQQGYVGVSMFFVLSGFLITRIYFDGVVNGRASLRLFFVKRVARIWPLFLVYAIVQHVGLAMQGQPLDAGAWVTMTMSQGFFAGLYHEGLPTAWSLTVEENFYALAPLFFLTIAALAPAERNGASLAPRRLWRVLLAIGAIAVAMVLAGEALMALVRSQGWTWRGLMANRYHLWHATLFGRMLEFSIGIFCAFLHRGGWTERHLSGRRAVWALAGAFLSLRIDAWVPGMSSGRGWIALVIIWLGFRRPMGVLIASYLFALTEIISGQAQGRWNAPASLLLALPYLVALVALTAATIAGRWERK